MSYAGSNFESGRAWAVNLPMRTAFSSAATTLDHRQLVLFRVDAGGHSGWGEAAPYPGHTVETIADIWSQVTTKPPERFTGLARAALEAATIDLAAKTAGEPLWQLLGGVTDVSASAAIGVDVTGRPDERQLEAVAGAGYRFAKLKVTEETDPAWLAEVAADLPGITFGLDANGSLADAPREKLEELDSLGFAYLEQPGASEDLEGHRRLRSWLRTPLALDESATTRAAIEEIVRRGAADIVNLKVGRFGPRSTLALARGIRDRGLQARLGGLIESGVGRAHSVAVASCAEFDVVGDIAGSDLYFDDDLVTPAWRVEQAILTLPPGPGIGVSINMDLVESVAVETAELRPS
jgi:O-succinylbenzoate synthase